jgi:RNA polymerase sigma-70 factor (ECF subfamily)
MPSDVETPTATREEVELVAAIRAGDERAFATAVERHYRGMLAVAKAYARAPADAARAVHDAWMSALATSGEFDGSAPLRTWLLRCAARAAAPLAAERDGRAADTTAPAPAVGPDRFRAGRDAFPGHWRAYPTDWRALPAEVLRGEETRRVVEDAIAALPVEQRAAITLRDVLRCPPRDACAVLDVPDEELRRRLHEARSRVRAALERHLDA